MSRPRSKSASPVKSTTEQATEHFVKGVITRGEAAMPVDGKLPPGATHEITADENSPQPKIKRRRFSMM